ncbi:MAG: Abi-alpha family protein [Nevskia sp.]
MPGDVPTRAPTLHNNNPRGDRARHQRPSIMSKDPSPLWKRAIDRAIGSDAADAPLASRLLKRLPGGEFAREQLDKIERRVMQELKQRLDRIERAESTVSVVAFAVEPPPPTPEQKQRAAGEMLRKLLEASTEQTREQAQAAYYAMIVGNLLPDEARILSALSDGSVYPLVHVMSAPKIGLGSVAALENVSSVGKNAGVQWPEMTPGYVQRLIAAGLAETGAEDYALIMKYEILETDEAVRRMLEQIRKAGNRGQIRRRTLRISELGSRLWQACRITED